MSDRPSTTGDREVRAYRVVGRVQGVGFRWWTRREAERLGIDGYVRNASDGSVEVLAVGTPDALVRLERSLRRGPPMSTVDGVERIEEVAEGEWEGFAIAT